MKFYYYYKAGIKIYTIHLTVGIWRARFHGSELYEENQTL